MTFSRFFTRTIAALSIVTLASFALPSVARADDSVNQLKKNDPTAFEWLEGVQEVNQGDQLVIPTKVKLSDFEKRQSDQADSKNSRFATPFAVYSDAALDVDLEFEIGTYGTEGISISPSWLTLQSQSHPSPLADITGSSGWGLLPMYYLVQYNDLQTGKLLEHPIVRRIRVSDEGFLPRPQNISVDEEDNGTFSVSWDPVEGADSYYVVFLNSTDKDGTTKLRPKLVATTNQTSWNSDQRADDEPQRDRTLNTALDAFLTVQEDSKGSSREGEGWLTDEELDRILNSKGTQVSVIAKKNAKISKMSNFIDIANTLGNTPIRIAFNAQRQLGLDRSRFDNLSELPAQIPVTMADGHTRMQSLVVDPEKSWVASSNPKTIKDPEAKLHVVYHIGNTRFTSSYIVNNFDPSTYTEDLQKLKKDQEKANTGYFAPNLTYTKQVQKKESNDNVARTFPDTPVQVLGTTPLSKYVAANLMMGYTNIDLSQFPEAESDSRIKAALIEAKDQNGLIPFIIGREYSPKDKILHVTLGTEGATDQHLAPKDYSGQINSKADQVVAEIIKPGMDEETKVRTINSWIINHATYNYDGLEGSHKVWEKTGTLTPEYTPDHDAGGIFFKGTTVCEGYANVFQLLATKSGLSSVVVTGLVTLRNGSKSGHAWNQVKVNGTWKTVDTTWNDGGDSGDPAVETKYLMIPNNDPLLTRNRVWKDPALKKIL